MIVSYTDKEVKEQRTCGFWYANRFSHLYWACLSKETLTTDYTGCISIILGGWGPDPHFFGVGGRTPTL